MENNWLDEAEERSTIGVKRKESDKKRRPKHNDTEKRNKTNTKKKEIKTIHACVQYNIGEPKDTKWKCSLNKNLIWNSVINTREIAVNSVVVVLLVE